MKILSRPKGNAEEYGRWSVNPYLGCPNQCSYCYLKKGPGAKNVGGSSAQLKAHIVNAEHAYHVAMAEIIENQKQIRKDGGLFFTFTSDPLIPETRNLNYTIANEAMMMHIPVTFLTKSDVCNVRYRHVATSREMQLPLPTKDLFGQYAAFGWTLTGCDELEKNAPKWTDRIGCMKGFHAAGFKVWASLEPVIDFNATVKMFRYALGSGCQHFKIGLLTDRTRVAVGHYRKKYGDFLERDLNNFIDEIQEMNRDHCATIYWKKSIQQLTSRDLSALPNAVGKDWSMFK